MRRRSFLAATSLAALSGCLNPDVSDLGRITTRGTPSPPVADVQHIEPPYPFRFDGELELSAGTPAGWFFAGAFIKNYALVGEVLEGGPVSVFATTEEITDSRTPDSTFRTLRDVDSFDTDIGVVDGPGSLVFVADRDTTLELSLEVTTV